MIELISEAGSFDIVAAQGTQERSSGTPLEQWSTYGRLEERLGLLPGAYIYRSDGAGPVLPRGCSSGFLRRHGHARSLSGPPESLCGTAARVSPLGSRFPPRPRSEHGRRSGRGEKWKESRLDGPGEPGTLEGERSVHVAADSFSRLDRSSSHLPFLPDIVREGPLAGRNAGAECHGRHASLAERREVVSSGQPWSGWRRE